MNPIKMTFVGLAALGVAALGLACDKKDNDSTSKSQAAADRGSAGPASASAPAAAPSVKLVALDLSSAGDDDFKGLSIQAPEGAKAKSSFGLVVAKEPSFQSSSTRRRRSLPTARPRLRRTTSTS